jgi:hypothetical protein
MKEKTYEVYSNISRYDEMIYESRPVSFDEYMSDKYNKVHIELFNDALKKFYDDLIGNLINKRFMFEFFRLLEGTYDENEDVYFSNFYNKLINDKKNYINNVIKELGIDGTKLIKELIKISNTYINNLKTEIVNNDVLLKPVSDIFEALSSITDINDFRIIYCDTATYLEAENAEGLWGHSFASYIITTNNENEYEHTVITAQKYLFMSEAENYVFLLENDSGTRIAYNIYGEFFLILDNAIYNTDNDNTFNINNYLLKSNKGILQEFKEYILSLYKVNHKVIEFKANEYWKPSGIYVISNVMPYTKKYFSLAKYWNYVQSKNDYNISDIKLTESKINDAELVELNYIKGKAKMYSKTEDIEFDVPFEYLNKDIGVSENYNLNLIK